MPPILSQRRAPIPHVALIAAAVIAAPMVATATDARLTDEASIDRVVAAMTIEEKARMIAGIGDGPTLVKGVAGATAAIARLGIPEIDYADGPVGVRLGWMGKDARTATAFPASVALAATWDPELTRRVAAAIGAEARSFGIDVMLAPGVNIQRHPLGGRNFEYFSEDPLLAGRMAAAYIDGVQSQGVGATLKHFAVNNQETNRDRVNVVVSERALREIYLPAFAYAVKTAKPWVVMSAYNAVNGRFSAENPHLLTQILRGEWGYDGFVMSDWYGVKDPIAAITAGNDLIMPGGQPPDPHQPPPDQIVLDALRNGRLPQPVVDQAIRRQLRAILKTPAFREPGPSPAADFQASAAIARHAAADGMVLLRNEGAALPLARGTRIATFGRDGRGLIIGGGGSSGVNADPTRVIALQDGLTAAGLTTVMTAGGHDLVEDAGEDTIAAADRSSDAALIVISRESTEGADRASMALYDDERTLIRRVAGTFHPAHKPVIVLLNIGGPVDMDDWPEQTDAILVTWLPGQAGGGAVADVLTGTVDPAGRLPLTFPKTLRNTPAFGNFPGAAGEVMYGEGFYVGYRHYDSRGIAPAYPFGFGLSYTRFSYTNLRASAPTLDLDQAAPIEIAVDVTNAGTRPGAEVAQLYLRRPGSRFEHPFQELKGFGKVTLAPGQTATVRFPLDREASSVFDPETRRPVDEAGRFTVAVGASSRDIRAELSLKAVGGIGPIGLTTPWLAIQTAPAASAVIARYLGDRAVNLWVWGQPTLADQLKFIFNDDPELKNDPARQKAVTDQILADLANL